MEGVLIVSKSLNFIAFVLHEMLGNRLYRLDMEAGEKVYKIEQGSDSDRGKVPRDLRQQHV